MYLLNLLNRNVKLNRHKQLFCENTMKIHFQLLHERSLIKETVWESRPTSCPTKSIWDAGSVPLSFETHFNKFFSLRVEQRGDGWHGEKLEAGDARGGGLYDHCKWRERDLFDKRRAPYALCISRLTFLCWQVWQKSCIGAQMWNFSEFWWLKVHRPQTNILVGAKHPTVQHLFWHHLLHLFVFSLWRTSFVAFVSSRLEGLTVFTLKV